MSFKDKLDKAYKSFNGHQSDLLGILIDMLEEEDLLEFGNWLDNETSISEHMNYQLYNKAFEQVYGHPAFDEDGNFYE